MSSSTNAILTALMAAFWFWLLWRVLRSSDVVGFKRGTASYAVIVALLLLFGVGAALQAVGL